MSAISASVDLFRSGRKVRPRTRVEKMRRHMQRVRGMSDTLHIKDGPMYVDVVDAQVTPWLRDYCEFHPGGQLVVYRDDYTKRGYITFRAEIRNRGDQ